MKTDNYKLALFVPEKESQMPCDKCPRQTSVRVCPQESGRGPGRGGQLDCFRDWLYRLRTWTENVLWREAIA